MPPTRPPMSCLAEGERLLPLLLPLETSPGLEVELLALVTVVEATEVTAWPSEVEVIVVLGTKTVVELEMAWVVVELGCAEEVVVEEGWDEVVVDREEDSGVDVVVEAEVGLGDEADGDVVGEAEEEVALKDVALEVDSSDDVGLEVGDEESDELSVEEEAPVTCRGART